MLFSENKYDDDDVGLSVCLSVCLYVYSSFGRSVSLSSGCIVEKRLIGSGCPLGGELDRSRMGVLDGGGGDR